MEAYRALLAELDGTRFVAVHMPAAPGVDLRSDASFDSLVREQENLTAHLSAAFSAGTFSHSLSAYEAMRAGNYMFVKVATAGNPPEPAYSLPSDPATWSYVRDEVRGESGQDVLAAGGESALALFFLATRDDGEARAIAGEVADELADWDGGRGPGVTGTPQASGLAYSSFYTDERNRDDLRVWGLVAVAGAALAVLVVVRRPENALVAALGLALATLAAFGIVGWLGLPVSFLTVFLAPIVTGIGMDFALHLLRRHEEERLRRPDREALAHALRRQGPALAASAAATTLGLAVLLLLPEPLFAQVGALGALGVGLAVAVSLTFTPALRAVLPGGPARARGDRIGSAMRRAGMAVHRHPTLALGAVLVLLGAGAAGATQVRFASGSAENEFPQDDPVIALQHQIEDEYGSFQRAYLVVQGDIARPEALRGLLAATQDAAGLPLYREAASVSDLVVADARTDQGALDILLLSAAPASDEELLPSTPAEARSALDRLFADPLWKSLAPFTVSRDYRLAVVAVQVEPWDDNGELGALSEALENRAVALQERLGDTYTVTAAGSPMNRAAVTDATPRDLAIAVLGTAAVVAATLGAAWARRGRHGVLATGAAVVVVLGSALLLLASVPALDALYRFGADEWGWAENTAPLTDMFLLAFAVTVAVGADGFVQVVHRAWEERGNGKGRDESVAAALQNTGRSVLGTALSTVAAFAPLAGLYFLQSKNLAILASLGAVYAFVLTMLLAPVVAGRVVAKEKAEPVSAPRPPGARRRNPS